VKNARTGKGIYKLADGESFKGNFVEGFLKGEGIYTLANGDSYEGSFETDGSGYVGFASNQNVFRTVAILAMSVVALMGVNILNRKAAQNNPITDPFP
jgi:hypothetical protein